MLSKMSGMNIYFPFGIWKIKLFSKIGWVLLLVSLIIVVWISQSQMANSWRIGIDENNKTKLVTKGYVFNIKKSNIS